jgi:two-component system cell cycle sensor histidine kinase/response regulator CckA
VRPGTGGHNTVMPSRPGSPGSVSVSTVVVHRHQSTREALADCARGRGHHVQAAAELPAQGPPPDLALVEWQGHLPPPLSGGKVVVIAVLEPLSAAAAEAALGAGADDCIDAGESPDLVCVRLAWAERRLRERRERAGALEDLRRLHKAVETMQVGVTITDLAGRVVYVNPAEAAMHGYDVREYVGQSARSLSPREDWRPLSAEQLRAMRKWRRERVRQRRDGSSFPVLLMSDVVTDGEGEPVGIVTVCEDITERRRAEEAEASSRERHRRFFEEDLAGAAVLSPAGVIQECNRAFAHMIGASAPDAARGREFGSVLRDPQAAAGILAQLAADGRAPQHDLELHRPDGHPMLVMASFVGVVDAAQALVEINSYFVDVTEHRALEEQLRQAQKMEAIGMLAGGVAHDFNNLLMVVWGFADQLLEQIPAEDPLRRCVEPIWKAAEKGASLTRQLLAVSRRDPVKPRVIDLNATVTEMNRMLVRLIGGAIQVETVASADPCLVELDPGHAEQLLLNLVVNARDAMPRGGHLTIETRTVQVGPVQARRHVDLAPGPYVTLTVRDTGVGMDARVRSHMFEPFFTTKTAGQGTGLGLATVYGIVKQARGSIACESAPGQGTTFRVFLPRAVGPGASEAQAPAVAPARASATVLLVESEADARELIRGYLAAVGYRVLEASHPQEALELCRGQAGVPIDLLIADLVMPQMTGPELARALRAERPQARVLFMSGAAEAVTDDQGLADARVAVLHKPFRAGELQARVHDVLAG